MRHTRSAAADAVSGAVGSLVALLAFYPADIMKTNLQAAASSSSISATNDRNNCDKSKEEHMNKVDSSLDSGLLSHPFSYYFRGVHYKAAHTVTSSFVYFFFHSFFVSTYTAAAAAARNNNRGKIKVNKSKVDISTSTRLFLSFLSAVLNTLVTLPLDVISARKQTSSPKLITDATLDDNNRPPVVKLNKEDTDSSDICTSMLSLSEEKKCEFKDEAGCLARNKSLTNELMNKNSRNKNQHVRENIVTNCDEHGKPSFSHLWQGLYPSLVLCSNPAIQYTAFDVIKSQIMAYKKVKWPDKVSKHNLSMFEIFFVGIAAKFLATIVTYPLIRAKVLIMVTKISDLIEPNLEMKSPKHCNVEKQVVKTTNSRLNMIAVLRQIYCSEGFRGLYKGCRMQLLHTLLKSALMLMIKEKISLHMRKMIVG